MAGTTENTRKPGCPPKGTPSVVAFLGGQRGQRVSPSLRSFITSPSLPHSHSWEGDHELLLCVTDPARLATAQPLAWSKGRERVRWWAAQARRLRGPVRQCSVFLRGMASCSNVTVAGGGAFGMGLAREAGGLLFGVSALGRETQRAPACRPPGRRRKEVAIREAGSESTSLTVLVIGDLRPALLPCLPCNPQS